MHGVASIVDLLQLFVSFLFVIEDVTLGRSFEVGPIKRLKCRPCPVVTTLIPFPVSFSFLYFCIDAWLVCSVHKSCVLFLLCISI